jgi:hypothetical protein
LFSLLSLPKTKSRIQTKEPYPLSHPPSLSICTNNVNLLLKENPKFNKIFLKKKKMMGRGEAGNDSVEIKVHPRQANTPAGSPPHPSQFQNQSVFKNWVPWLVPLFVVANVAVFIAVMYVNDCPSNSGSCVAPSLGRFSFQPLKENPLLGPSSST